MSRTPNWVKAVLALVGVMALGILLLVLVFGSQTEAPATPVSQVIPMSSSCPLPATGTSSSYPTPPASPTVSPPTPTPRPMPTAPFKVSKESQLTKGEDVTFCDWSPTSDSVLVGKYTGQTLQISSTTSVLMTDLWQYSIVEPSAPRKLAANARHARWSPDGQHILHLAPVDAQRQDIYVIDREGEQKTRVASGSYEGPAYWLPDNRICYTKGAHLWVVDADGRHAHVLNEHVNMSRSSNSEAWRFYLPSPDGRRLAYSENRLLFLMNLDGSDRRQVAEDVNPALVWSPDGRRLAYVVGPPSQLWIVQADGSAPQRLALGLRGHIRDPSWFPGGDLLAFCQWAPGTDTYRCCAESQVADMQGNAWLLGNGEGPRGLLGVSPDGRKIIFRRDDDLWVGFLSASQWQW